MSPGLAQSRPGRRSLSRTRRGSSFPKNSYQAFFARNELEHADWRIHEFVRQVHSPICREYAKSFHKATAAYARHGRTVFGFSSCDASERLTELRFAGGFPKTIHRRDIGIRPVAHSGHT